MLTFIAKLFAAGLIIWMGLLVLVLAAYAKRGGISLTGLLVHKNQPNVAPERALNAIVFPLILLYYVLEALHTDVTGPGRPSLPDIDQSLLVLLTGTNGLFLAGKIARSNAGGGA